MYPLIDTEIYTCIYKYVHRAAKYTSTLNVTTVVGVKMSAAWAAVV